MKKTQSEENPELKEDPDSESDDRTAESDDIKTDSKSDEEADGTLTSIVLDRLSKSGEAIALLSILRLRLSSGERFSTEVLGQQVC